MDRKIAIFLTGASGHVGSRWLAEPASCVGKVYALLKPGDVFPQASSTIIQKQVHEGRIPAVDPTALLEGVDVVIHLAAVTPADGIPDREYMAVNKDWTIRLGEACLERKVKLIFASTSSVYSGRNGELLKEETPYIQPQNAYAESKYAAESALHTLYMKGLSVSMLRFGSVFGLSSGMNSRTAINRFVQQAAQGKPIEVWRTARDQIRPFTYVGDCVAAINFIIEREIWDGQVYNIVSENSTVPAIIEIIKKIVPTSTVRLVDSERMNDLSYGADDQKIRSLGFVNRCNIAEGISELLAEDR